MATFLFRVSVPTSRKPQDAKLLPLGLIRDLGRNLRKQPTIFTAQLSELFRLMSTEPGGTFGPLPIQWFNGGLFDGPDVLPLTTEQIDVITQVSLLDWSQIEPTVFGTLFERGLDPDKRSQLGAHYTDRTSIERVVHPVLVEPLEREWTTLRDDVAKLIAGYDIGRSLSDKKKKKDRPKVIGQAGGLVSQFLTRLNAVRVLDPACGSGNFLYVALQSLKDLERRVVVWEATELLTPMRFPTIGPHNVRGIELNSYAAELARVSIWIGEIQWMIANGFAYLHDPVLRPLESIECRDAVLDLSDPLVPREPEWPSAYAIIGNPPFIGNKLLRTNLGDEYAEELFKVYHERLSGVDFICYWYEKARAMVANGRAKRVGLLATQGIRNGANRKVLERIKGSGDIFMAWSDEPWVVEGAAVHVSIVGYDDGSETHRVLDGVPVLAINSDLSAGIDLTKAKVLTENAGIAFQGPVKVGPFNIDAALAQRMLAAPNPHGRSNRGVLKPWINGLDITRRPRHMWIIDFAEMTEEEAALYEAPFEYVRRYVYPRRVNNKDRQRKENWWRLGRSGADLRQATEDLDRFLVTPRVSKYRFFVWVEAGTLPDSAVVAIACDDDYSFGVLHSCVHELWARAQGSQLREAESGFRYTPSSTFETFPFPCPTSVQAEIVAAAARALDSFRRGWLDPEGVSPLYLRGRTLTNLYNQTPTWLVQAHDRLDRAVFAAYG